MLLLCLIKHHAVKTYGKNEDKDPSFLASALDEDEMSVSHPDYYIPSGIHCV
jgi:hypothetical protein